MKYIFLILLLVTLSNSVSAENQYFIAEGSEDGKPLIFRGISEIPKWISVSDYPNRVSVYWDYKSNSGMPELNTNTRQTEFENALEELNIDELGVFVLVITGNGRKEWHWYVSSKKNWMKKFNENLKGLPVFPIELVLTNEPEWSFYKKIMSGFKK